MNYTPVQNKVPRTNDWKFYCQVLAAGRIYYGIDKVGVLGRAYREIGPFREVTSEHLTRMYQKYTTTQG